MANITDEEKQMKSDLKSDEKEVYANQKETDRLQRQNKRFYKKDEKAFNTVISDSKQAGYDFTSTKKPIESSSKIITEEAKKLASKDIAGKLDSFQKSYQPFSKQEVADPDMAAMKRDERIAKRKKWAEALYTFGQTYQGRQIDKSMMPSEKAKRNRDEQFSNYKTGTERNRQSRDVYDAKYRNDLMSYIDKELAKESGSEMEKQKLRLIKAQIAKTNRPTSSKGKETSTQYTDILYNEAENPETLFPFKGKDKPLDVKQKEDYAKQIVLQGYDVSKGSDGKPSYTPKKGKENYVNYLKAQNQLKQEQAGLSDLESQMQTEIDDSGVLGMFKGEDKIRSSYQEAFDEINARINQLKNVPIGNSTSQKTNTQAKEQQHVKSQTSSFFDKYK